MLTQTIITHLEGIEVVPHGRQSRLLLPQRRLRRQPRRLLFVAALAAAAAAAALAVVAVAALRYFLEEPLPGFAPSQVAGLADGLADGLWPEADAVQKRPEPPLLRRMLRVNNTGPPRPSCAAAAAAAAAAEGALQLIGRMRCPRRALAAPNELFLRELPWVARGEAFEMVVDLNLGFVFIIGRGRRGERKGTRKRRRRRRI